MTSSYCYTITFLSISDAELKSQVYVFNNAKHFQAFYYYYKLARGRRRRIEKILKSNDTGYVLTEDVLIKIGIVWKFRDVDLKFISKGRGNNNSIAKYVPKLYFNLHFFFYQI